MGKVLAVLVGVLVIAVAAVGWLQRPDHITASEAIRAATAAFEAADLEEASVDRRAVRGTYDPASGRNPVDVWKTSATLEGGTVELWLARDDGEPVFLDDRSPDGTAQLLTDDQFRRIADHFENPALARQVRRNLVLTFAAVLILGLTVLLASAVGSSRQESR